MTDDEQGLSEQLPDSLSTETEPSSGTPCDETYRSFFSSLVFVTSYGVICYVEGVVSSRGLRIEPSLDHEGVRLSSYDVDLGYEEAVYVPGDSPAHVTCKPRTSVLVPRPSWRAHRHVDLV